ncbi:MAG: hypothetical protein LQ351_001995 [Letrouitia transgressa]|nr:MAG: hypothetical protein LQ351_001995 [Letrouitia transgressa]
MTWFLQTDRGSGGEFGGAGGGGGQWVVAEEEEGLVEEKEGPAAERTESREGAKDSIQIVLEERASKSTKILAQSIQASKGIEVTLLDSPKESSE